MIKPKPQNSIRIAQITDSHLFEDSNKELLGVNTSHSFQAICTHIAENCSGIDMVLATGDISHDGSDHSYEYFFDSVAKLAPIVRSLPGNHDLAKKITISWQQYSPAISDIGSWQIISLDSTIAGSNGGALNQDQLDILEKACNKAKDKNILVALHHNPIPMSCHWLDTMMLANSSEFMEIIAKHKNIKVVVWGHVHQEYDHTYEFSDHHKVRFLASPATSIQFMPNSKKFGLDTKDPGYRIIDLLDNGAINTQVIRVANTGIKPALKSTGY